METTERTIRKASVCVIGGAGFLGSHLVDHLIDDRECSVLVLDNLITGLRKFVHPQAKFQWCDITHSENELIKIFRENKVEYVFNYSAEPYIPVSFQRPLHVFDINARGALMVLNAAHEAGVRGVLQISSAEIYGDQKGKIRETDQARPHSSYGASKLAIDMLVQTRWKEAKTPAIALRQFNCVGARETHPYVIPEIISQIARQGEKAIVMLGNNSSRDFLWAKDAVKMATLLLEKGEFGEVYNMGSEDTVGIYELAIKIGKLMGRKVEVLPDTTRMRPWEIWHLQSNNEKLYQAIGDYTPSSLSIGLEAALLYFKENNNSWDF